MIIRIGHWKIEPSKIPKWISHKKDHFKYDFLEIHAAGTGYILNFAIYDSYIEKKFNEQHREKFPPGSYEAFRRV